MSTLLVVDDDAAIRNYVRLSLTKRGWTVLEAEDGVDGVGRFLLYAPKVLLTDISMPRCDGIEMVRNLKKSELLEKTKVVVMSGVLDKSDPSLNALGVTTFLRKPFTLAQLYLAVGDSGHVPK